MSIAKIMWVGGVMAVALGGCRPAPPSPAVKAQAPAPVAAVLPAFFVDVLVMPAVEREYQLVGATGLLEKKKFLFPGLKAPFKMILVPGDPAKGIAPFYMGETEVGWDLFRPWSHWYDVTVIEAVKEMSKEMRPSNIDHECDTSHNDKRYSGYPALGMTRLNAEKFCEMLSKRTGRKYRLPTEAEWEHAYALGGGDPADKLAYAVCKENAEETPESFEPCPSQLKSKKPNTLGFYDMLGNVAEWVKTPGAADRDGKNTFVRGGDYTTPLKDLTGARREESDNRRNKEGSWNRDYPNAPESKWWYLNHYQIGFRLVCEPVNLPEALP